jgi:hypothetical protein
MKRIVNLASSALLGAAILGSSVTPAIAAGFFTTVHVTTNTQYSYGGWVDGNGPDSYYALAVCKDWSVALGVEHWAGDHRGSLATCPTSTGGIMSVSTYPYAKQLVLTDK